MTEPRCFASNLSVDRFDDVSPVVLNTDERYTCLLTFERQTPNSKEHRHERQNVSKSNSRERSCRAARTVVRSACDLQAPPQEATASSRSSSRHDCLSCLVAFVLAVEASFDDVIDPT